MEIKTKFDLGDEVYNVYVEKGEVRILTDVIKEIFVCLDQKENMYFLDGICDEVKESEIVKTNNKEELMNLINIKLQELQKNKNNTNN